MFKCIKNFLSKLIEEESALLSPPLCGDNKDISPLQSCHLLHNNFDLYFFFNDRK